MRPSCFQSNIHISNLTKPRAILADFCFTHVATVSVALSSEDQGTPSFMAPELLLPTKFGLTKGVPSKEADIYALGMTIYQVMTGKLPFPQRRKARVMYAVMSGERPPKPENGIRVCVSPPRIPSPRQRAITKNLFGHYAFVLRTLAVAGPKPMKLRVLMVSGGACRFPFRVLARP